MIDYETMELNQIKDNLKMVIRALNEQNERLTIIENYLEEQSGNYVEVRAYD